MKSLSRRFVTLLITVLTLCTFSACGVVEKPVTEFTPSVNTNANIPDDIVYHDIKLNAATIPAYSGNPVYIVNNNIPFFEAGDIMPEAFEEYAELDSLGRCGVAYANICVELMPEEEREGIGQVKPSGWQTAKYDIINGKYLYNRCHLIGFQLAGENANEKNLITGTRYLNIDGMLPYENMIADYVKETENHVLYRVTPVYTGNNLVAEGVLMEAYSVEDNGEGIKFSVFAYNVQPGIGINYSNGESWLGGAELATTPTESPYKENPDGIIYILNVESKKYHLDTCRHAKNMAEENKETFNGTKNWLEDNGYVSCGVCKP